MTLAVFGPTHGIEKAFLGKVAKAAFSYFPEKNGEIELKFVAEDQIRSLNMVYRGIDKATDVLSFNISDEPLIGQIFICYNVTKRQAEKANKPLKDEIGLLLVHGILHIFGYDHVSIEQEKEMQKLETDILAKIGVTR